MARMVPDLNADSLREVPSAAERDVYAALRDGADNRTLVIHSLCLVSRQAGAGARDSETDFVIIHPDFGFLTIEVKGGGVSFDASSGQWFSKDRRGETHKISDPFRQARSGKYELLRLLKTAPEWGPNGPPRILCAHAVLFPDLTSTRPLKGPDRPVELIGCRADVQQIRTWIEQVFAYWAGEDSRWTPLTTAGVKAIETALCKSVTVLPPLAHVVKRDANRQVVLTDKQARILRALRLRTRAAIAGGAGTGKTVLALKHAMDLAAQDIKTLFVCYNQPLADTLAERAQGIANLHVMNFHQLCYRLVGQVRRSCGIDFFAKAQEAYPGGDEWAVQWPFALSLATEHVSPKFGAIVVDEGQDFQDEYWLPLDLLLQDADESRLYVFYDTNQTFYRPSAQIPISEPPLLLTENCRNTRPIHEAAYRFYSGDDVDPPDIEGAPAEVVHSTGLTDQARQVRNLVARLVRDEGLAVHDVVVVVMGQPKHAYYRELEATQLSHGLSWGIEQPRREKTIQVDTVRRFKGLESLVVVLWGADAVHAAADKELIYVALSRARSRLFLVGDEKKIVQTIGQA